MVERRVRLLLREASATLAASLDYQSIVQSFARILVPLLADCCAVHIVGDPEPRVQGAMADRDLATLLESLPGRAEALRTGRSQLVSLVPRERGAARGGHQLARLRAAGFRSAAMLPLLSAGAAVMGTVTLLSAKPARRYSRADLAVAEELSRLGALAIAHAQLSQTERDARHHAERSLWTRQETDEQLRAILDHTSTLIFVKDPNGRVVFVNRAYEQTFHVKGQIVGKTAHELFPGEPAEQMEAADLKAVAERKPITREQLVPQEDGPHYHLTTRFPVFDGNGQLRWICGLATDITDRKRAEQALRQSEERFSKIFDASPVAIAITTLAEGRFVDVNQSCAELTGFSREELIGRVTTELNLWKVEERRALIDKIKHMGSVRDLEMTMRRKSGEQREMLVSLERLDLGGEPCLLSLAFDITDRKRLKERLEHSHKMEAIGRLAGGVAHDFNNILTALGGYGELIAEALPTRSPLRRLAQQAQKMAARAGALTTKLLAISRKQVGSPVTLDLNHVITDMHPILARVIGEDIELHLELQPSLGRIQADPLQIEQVILNLAVNARDSMSHGGQVTLATSDTELDDSLAHTSGVAPGPYVKLSMTDTGCGIDLETQAHLFEPFFTTKDPGKGTGLGLSIVYGIVQQSGGQIQVVSSPGEGSTFHLYFPRHEGPAALPPAPTRRAPVPRGSETILVVEDDDGVRDFVRRVLAALGYTVLVAQSGLEAVEIAERHASRIDLLLCDVVMPRMTGREVADRVAQIRPGIRLLHMSGYAGDINSRYGDVSRGAAFLGKPFSRELLADKVRAVLDQPA